MMVDGTCDQYRSIERLQCNEMDDSERKTIIRIVMMNVILHMYYVYCYLNLQ